MASHRLLRAWLAVFALSVAATPALSAPCLLTPDEHGCVDQRAIASARHHKAARHSRSPTPRGRLASPAPRFPGPKGPPEMLTPQRDDH